MPRSITKLAVRCAASAGVIAAVALSALPASAQPAAHGQQCILNRNIDGFNAPNNRTVYVRTGVDNVYRLDLMIDCVGLAFRNRVAVESAAGDPWICDPIQATVVYREAGIPTRCPVSAIHKLTPAELSALPPRDRP